VSPVERHIDAAPSLTKGTHHDVPARSLCSETEDLAGVDALATGVVEAFYRFFVMRDPDPRGLAGYTSQLKNSLSPAETVFAMLKGFLDSEEARHKQPAFLVQRLGQADLHRRWAGGLSPANADFLGRNIIESGQATHVLVTGMPRSGTSALVSLINFSRDFAVTNERFVFPDRDALLPETLSQDSIARFLRDSGTGETTGFDPIVRRLFPSFFDVGHSADDLNPDVREFMTGRAADVRDSRLNWSVGGDKLTNPSMWALPLRLAANPGLRVVFGLREPMQVLRSAMRKAALDPGFASGFSAIDFEQELLA